MTAKDAREAALTTVSIHVDTADMDAAIEKMERLCRLLKEAKSLIADIAHGDTVWDIDGAMLAQVVAPTHEEQ